MDSKCTYIIGFDIHDNDQLRDIFVKSIKEELKAEMINQSCYKLKLTDAVGVVKLNLTKIIDKCTQQCGAFKSDDFIKLYCSALADCKTNFRHSINEYNIDLNYE